MRRVLQSILSSEMTLRECPSLLYHNCLTSTSIAGLGTLLVLSIYLDVSSMSSTECILMTGSDVMTSIVDTIYRGHTAVIGF